MADSTLTIQININTRETKHNLIYPCSIHNLYRNTQINTKLQQQHQQQQQWFHQNIN